MISTPISCLGVYLTVRCSLWSKLPLIWNLHGDCFLYDSPSLVTILKPSALTIDIQSCSILISKIWFRFHSLCQFWSDENADQARCLVFPILSKILWILRNSDLYFSSHYLGNYCLIIIIIILYVLLRFSIRNFLISMYFIETGCDSSIFDFTSFYFSVWWGYKFSNRSLSHSLSVYIRPWRYMSQSHARSLELKYYFGVLRC